MLGADLDGRGRQGRRGTARNPQQREGDVDDRADEQREGERAEADLAAEHGADEQHRDLDAGAHGPDRPAGAGVQPGHQPVARAGTQAGADVETGGDAHEQQAAREDESLEHRLVLLRHDEQEQLCERPDEQHVGHGAETGLLPDRDPEQQHERPDDVDDDAEGQAGLRGDALGEHVPGRDADTGAHHQPDAEPVEGEADDQLAPTTGPEESG